MKRDSAEAIVKALASLQYFRSDDGSTYFTGDNIPVNYEFSLVRRARRYLKSKKKGKP
jgi:hypothetical protein